MIKNRYCCDGCVFEEVCEVDSIMSCRDCQGMDAVIEEISLRYWNEMSYRKYIGGLLDWNYDEYADGE